MADSGLYSAENVARLSAAGVRWISRVPDTSTEAKAALAVADDGLAAGGRPLLGVGPAGPGGERWVVVRTTAGRGAGPQRRCSGRWTRRAPSGRRRSGIWATSASPVCPTRRRPWRQQLKKCPAWLQVQACSSCSPSTAGPDAHARTRLPTSVEWQILATLTVDEAAVAREVRRKAAFLVATNVLDPDQLSDQELIQTYKEQHSVERGFSFLKDPLFLASSVFVKKPERIVALSLVMVLCLLVYRLAEHRLREQLAATGQTVPNQLKQPTDRPTMRWIFQCFEGVSLVVFQPPQGPPHRIWPAWNRCTSRWPLSWDRSCEKLYKVDD